MVVGLLAGLLASALYGAPSALLAHASRRLPAHPWWRALAAGARDRLVLAVMATYTAGAVAHYAAIQLLPLYVVQAEVAGSLVFTAIAAAIWLGEWPYRHHWLSLAGICGGLVLLALASGDPGDDPIATTFWVSAYLCALGCGLLGLVGLHLRGARSAAVLGVVSGLAFGGVPIGARLLEAPFLRWDTLLPLCFVAICGLLGFGLYSRALQHARVTAVTAPQALLQTALPALVGLTVFGDGVRGGWWWAVLAGLGLSMAGTLGLAATAAPLPTAPTDLPDKVDA